MKIILALLIVFMGSSGALGQIIIHRAFPIDTDVSLAANSDLTVPSQKAIKAFVLANPVGSGIQLQVSTPGTPQVGHINLTGTIIANGTPSFKGGTIASSADVQFHAAEAIIAHAHYGFCDTSTVNYSGVALQGHASFNDNITITGTQDSDHHRSFQSYPHFTGSGTVTNLVSFSSLADVTGTGTISNTYGLAVYNPTGIGTITNLYGVYVAGLTRGTTNWGIYVDGITPSYFGGDVNMSRILRLGTPVDSGDYYFNFTIMKDLSTYDGVRFGYNNTTHAGIIAPTEVHDLEFWTANGSTFGRRAIISAAGNFGINTGSFGTSAVGVLGMGTGTAPSTAPAGMAQMWTGLLNGAGTTGFRFMNEVATTVYTMTGISGVTAASTGTITLKSPSANSANISGYLTMINHLGVEVYVPYLAAIP